MGRRPTAQTLEKVAIDLKFGLHDMFPTVSDEKWMAEAERHWIPRALPGSKLAPPSWQRLPECVGGGGQRRHVEVVAGSGNSCPHPAVAICNEVSARANTGTPPAFACSEVPYLENNYDPELGDVFREGLAKRDGAVGDMWGLWEAFDVTKPLAVVRGANSDLLSAETLEAMQASRDHLIAVNGEIAYRACDDLIAVTGACAA